LGIFDKDIEVAIIVEDSRVEQFKLRLVFPTTPVLLNEARIGKLSLGIFVEHLQIRVGRRGIEVVINFFHVFAVIPLAISETEQALFQNGVFAIPKRQCKAEPLRFIADAANAVLAPTISTAARLIMGKIIPGIAVRAVVLSNCAPLAL